MSAVMRYFLAELYWTCHCVAYSFSPSGQALLQVCLRPYFFISVVDPDPESDALSLDLGSGIGLFQISDSGSRISDPGSRIFG